MRCIIYTQYVVYEKGRRAENGRHFIPKDWWNSGIKSGGAQGREKLGARNLYNHLQVITDRPCVLFHILQNTWDISAATWKTGTSASILPPKILSDLPPSCPARYPALLSPWILWVLFWSHSLVSASYLALCLATVLDFNLGFSLHPSESWGVIWGVFSGSACSTPTFVPWPPTHLTNIAA